MARDALAAQSLMPGVRASALNTHSPCRGSRVARPKTFSEPPRLHGTAIGKQPLAMALGLHLLRVIQARLFFVAVRPRMPLQHHPRPHVMPLAGQLRQQAPVGVSVAAFDIDGLSLQQAL